MQLSQRCTESFSRATNAAFAGVAKLCDSQTLIESRDRSAHCTVYMCTHVSNPSSLSIIYGDTLQIQINQEIIQTKGCQELSSAIPY